MPRGLPASYIKKAKKELGKGASFSRIFKRAWQLYKGSKVYKALKGENPRKKSKTKKGGSRKVARKKRRYSRKMTIPLAPVIGFLGTEAMQNTIKNLMAGKHQEAMRYLPHLVGLHSDGTFHWQTLLNNMTPIIIGLLVHKFVGGSPLNLNRTLARHKVPLIRI